MKNKKINLKNTSSKWMMFVCTVILSLIFTSCEKDDKTEDPSAFEAGQIPGLGDTEGNLTGTPFQLPDGVEITGDITGSANQDNYWDLYSSYASPRSFISKDGNVENKTFTSLRSAEEETTIYYYGSGYGYVDLLIPLRNIRSNPVTVTFPAATILVSKAGDCQNGVLIKKVTVTIPANSEYSICLSFYCGNLSKSSAHRNDVYVLGVVSNAKPLLDLCDRVKNKQINIEEFSRTSVADYERYCSQVNRLQSIVWNVTDWNGMTEWDIEYINSLPNN